MLSRTSRYDGFHSLFPLWVSQSNSAGRKLSMWYRWHIGWQMCPVCRWSNIKQQPLTYDKPPFQKQTPKQRKPRNAPWSSGISGENCQTYHECDDRCGQQTIHQPARLRNIRFGYISYRINPYIFHTHTKLRSNRLLQKIQEEIVSHIPVAKRKERIPSMFVCSCKIRHNLDLLKTPPAYSKF